MTAADHVLAALLAAFSIALVFLRPPHDPALPRRDLYVSGALTGTAFAVVVLSFWSLAERPLADFGLAGWSASPAVVAAGVAWVAMLAVSLRLARQGMLRGPLDRLYARYAWLMPRSRAELAGSWVTSAAAGAGEEIAYRGFLLWYGTALLGPLGGLAASSLLFGAAHVAPPSSSVHARAAARSVRPKVQPPRPKRASGRPPACQTSNTTPAKAKPLRAPER